MTRALKLKSLPLAVQAQIRPKEKRPPRKPSRGEEAALMKQIKRWLTRRKIFHLRLNSGAARIGGALVRMAPAGTADYLAVLDGMACFLEAKAPKGKQNDAQRAFQKAAEAAGAVYRVVRSVEELEAALGGREDG